MELRNDWAVGSKRKQPQQPEVGTEVCRFLNQDQVRDVRCTAFFDLVKQSVERLAIDAELSSRRKLGHDKINVEGW
jgi:hypothetical protein